MAALDLDLSKKVGPAVGRVTGHWPGGNDWEVFGCVGCGFAEVRFHSGIRLRASVNVRGWNLPAAPVYPAAQQSQGGS
jgi:hypothetical protein